MLCPAPAALGAVIAPNAAFGGGGGSKAPSSARARRWLLILWTFSLQANWLFE